MEIPEIITALVPTFATASKLCMYLARMKNAGVGERHIMRWVQMQVPGAIELEPRWTELLVESRRAITNGDLVLIGDKGVGKSQMAATLIADKCRSVSWDCPKPPQMLLLSEMLQRIRATFSPDADTTEAAEMQRLTHASLLVVDELQDGSGTLFSEQKLTDIIAIRYKSSLPTVFCANVPYEALPAALGPSIVDRFQEGSSGVIECDWTSVRSKTETLPRLADLMEPLGKMMKAEQEAAMEKVADEQRKSWLKRKEQA